MTVARLLSRFPLPPEGDQGEGRASRNIPMPSLTPTPLPEGEGLSRFLGKVRT